MSEHADTAPAVALLQADDCWNRIGVRGDGSCPELKQYVHCRNCPVQTAVAADLLASVRSGQYLAEWTDHIAQPKCVEERDTQSVLIFRLGAEWLALPTSVVQEVADPKPVHSVPHRKSGVVLGLASVRGELHRVRVAGGRARTGTASRITQPASRTVYRRLLLIRREEVRVVCPVDEVHGVHRFPPGALKDVPDTLAKAATRYSKSLLPWKDHSVALLDEHLLFYTLKRSLA